MKFDFQGLNFENNTLKNLFILLKYIRLIYRDYTFKITRTHKTIRNTKKLGSSKYKT